MRGPYQPPQPVTGNESPALRRSALLAGMLAFWMLVVVARLYYLQIIQYVQFFARAQRQQQRTVELAPQRGEVFDRQMRPLAMSIAVDSVFAVPSEIPDRGTVAKLLGPLLGLDVAELEGRLNAVHSFCWVKRKVGGEEAARVQDLNLKGIYFEKEMKRFYPKDRLAAGVLGYVGMDDNGLAGLEYGMNEEIRGRPGVVFLAEDARRQSFRMSERAGVPGKNVVLSLDENIQYLAERALAEGVEKWQAKGGTVVVQNPNTGEILALAGEPSFNPNDYSKSVPEVRNSRGVTWVYEPGSTLKLITVSAALEEGLTHPADVIDCQMGSITLAGHVIHDWKRFGALTAEQVLVNSSDVGAIKLGLRLGEDRLYQYIRAYGFGNRTEIELPGEERGLLKPPGHWSGISVGELSIGQEIGVTGVQLVTAYSAVANGGVLLQPRILRDVFLDGTHDPIRPVAGHRVVSARTAETMREMLMQVVEQGTGKSARLNGYSAGGKTGTAQKVDPSGAYSTSHYVSSFVGFAPAYHPAITILVSIDSPVGGHHGGQVAAPIFREIAEQALSYLNVPQDRPSSSPQLLASKPAVSAGVQNLPLGSGPARPAWEATAGALPLGSEDGEPVPASVQTVSYTDSIATPTEGTVVLNGGPSVTVPDFSGMAKRRVADECQEIGLELSVSGSGLAVEQNPPLGTKVIPGAQIWVRFAR